MNREPVTVQDVLENIAAAFDGEALMVFRGDKEDSTAVVVEWPYTQPVVGFRLGTGQTFRITVEEVK